jgi:hypothetical protein
MMALDGRLREMSRKFVLSLSYPKTVIGRAFSTTQSPAPRDPPAPRNLLKVNAQYYVNGTAYFRGVRQWRRNVPVACINGVMQGVSWSGNARQMHPWRHKLPLPQIFAQTVRTLADGG